MNGGKQTAAQLVKSCQTLNVLQLMRVEYTELEFA